MTQEDLETLKQQWLRATEANKSWTAEAYIYALQDELHSFKDRAYTAITELGLAKNTIRFVERELNEGRTDEEIMNTINRFKNKEN